MHNLSRRPQDSATDSNLGDVRLNPSARLREGAPGSHAPIDFVLVEEKTAVRQALAIALSINGSCRCCAQAGDPGAALDAISLLAPSVVVTGIDLAEGNGLDLIKLIKVRFPQVHVLVLSSHDESVYAELALHAGAVGYVMLTEPLEEVLRSIQIVAQGKVYLSQQMINRFLQKQIAGRTAPTHAGVELLSPREIQVLHLFGQWYSAKQIAAKLSLSVKTVSYYRDRIREKLGLHDSVGLTRFATTWAEGNGSDRGQTPSNMTQLD